MLNYLHIPHEQSKKTFDDLNQQQKKKKFLTNTWLLVFLIVTDVDTNLKGEGNQLKNSLKSKQNKHIEKGKVLKKTI